MNEGYLCNAQHCNGEGTKFHVKQPPSFLLSVSFTSIVIHFDDATRETTNNE